MCCRKYSIKIDHKRKLVKEVIVGGWSSLDVYHYHLDYVEEITPHFGGESWSKIVDLSKWLPSTTVVTAFGNYLSWASTLGGMKYIACVCVSEHQNKLLHRILEIAYMEEVSEIFSDSEAANFWLKSKGF